MDKRTGGKTSGTRRGTIPCNHPCRSTFCGFKTLALAMLSPSLYLATFWCTCYQNKLQHTTSCTDTDYPSYYTVVQSLEHTCTCGYGILFSLGKPLAQRLLPKAPRQQYTSRMPSSSAATPWQSQSHCTLFEQLHVSCLRSCRSMMDFSGPSQTTPCATQPHCGSRPLSLWDKED